MYEYKIANIRVVDGDTVDCDIDLGFDQWMHKQRIRLTGIDAPEIRTKNLEEKKLGLDAKQWLNEMLDTEVRLRCDEYNARGKFGRILGSLMIEISDGEWLNVNQAMIEEGHARYYDGGKR